MPIEAIDVLHGFSAGAFTITELKNHRTSPNLSVLLARSSGNLDNQFVANMEQKPEWTFDTPQIAAVLGATGVGLGDFSEENTDLYFRNAVNQGGRSALTEEIHQRIRASMGLLEWQRISATHNGEASISCRLVAAFNGTDAPLIHAGSVAADSITPSAADHWTVGPCYINGTQIPGVQSINIDRGGRLFQLGGDGELYATFNGEQTTDPTISIVTPKTAMWSSIGLNGLAITSASIYLRKIGVTSRVANNVASHIKFAAAAGLATIDDTSGDGENPNMTTP